MVVQNQTKILKKNIGNGVAKSLNSCQNDHQSISNMVGQGEAKKTRNSVEGGTRNIVNSVLNDSPHIVRNPISGVTRNIANSIQNDSPHIAAKPVGGGRKNLVNSIHNDSPHTARNPIGGGRKNLVNSTHTDSPQIARNPIGGGKKNLVNSTHTNSPQITNNLIGGGKKNLTNSTHNEPPHIGEGDIDMDVGSNTHSPAPEGNAYDDLMPSSNDQGRNKQKYTNKLAHRLQSVLSAHEATDPTCNEGNVVEENPPRKVKTKYFHQNRPTRNGTQQNDLNSSQASATSSKRKRGQRGKYRTFALEKKTLGGQRKLNIVIPDFVLQAVGENARSMVNFCGFVVRTTVVMNAGDWRDVFAKYGPSMWLKVKNKFDIKDSCTQLFRLQAFATYAMQRLYRFWKSRLHCYYHECGDTYEERLENPPEDFSDADWRACCATFNSDKFKQRSERNSKNRKSKKWYKHTTGNLSFPEVEHILTEQNDGVLPTADVVWLAEHTRTNSQGVLQWVNDDRSKEIHK